MVFDKDYWGTGFTRRAFKVHPEIVPLVGIMSVVMCGVTAMCVYALATKTDIKFNRKEHHRWDLIDLNKPQKLVTFNQTYGEDPAITALKKEIHEAYKGK